MDGVCGRRGDGGAGALTLYPKPNLTLTRARTPQVDADKMRRACEHVESVGSANQREIARLCERMRKFKLLAASSTESGEVENAERMYAKAQAEVQSRSSTEDQFTLVGWAPR